VFVGLFVVGFFYLSCLQFYAFGHVCFYAFVQVNLYGWSVGVGDKTNIPTLNAHAGVWLFCAVC
jgi:hypothetical protein